MPNWCHTSYKLVGDKKELSHLRDLINGLTEYELPLISSDSGFQWLGCVVAALGQDWDKVSCQGMILNMELEGNVLSFDTETTWQPCNKVLDLITKRFPSIRYYYYAREPGLEVYQTNDQFGEFFPYRAIVDTRSAQIEMAHELFESMELAYKWIEEKFNYPIHSVMDVNVLNLKLGRENDDYYINLHPIEVV